MKNIVIIGGTKGIGKSIVSEVVDNNNVVCLSRNQTDFKHDNYTYHHFDALVDDYPDLDSVDCLIYCPGSINLKPISTLSLDDFRNDFELNVIGAVRAIKKYLNLLKKSGSASILLFSTVATKLGMPYHASVSVAKSGIDGLVKTLGSELAPKVGSVTTTLANKTEKWNGVL